MAQDVITRHYIKRGDRLPELKGAFIDEETGSPVDLTGATLRMHMKDPETDELLIDAAAEIVGDPTLGRFRYAWAVGDTELAQGGYPFEIEATFPGNRPLSSPNRRNGTVVVTEDLRAVGP